MKRVLFLLLGLQLFFSNVSAQSLSVIYYHDFYSHPLLETAQAAARSLGVPLSIVEIFDNPEQRDKIEVFQENQILISLSPPYTRETLVWLVSRLSPQPETLTSALSIPSHPPLSPIGVGQAEVPILERVEKHAATQQTIALIQALKKEDAAFFTPPNTKAAPPPTSSSSSSESSPSNNPGGAQPSTALSKNSPSGSTPTPSASPTSSKIPSSPGHPAPSSKGVKNLSLPLSPGQIGSFSPSNDKGQEGSFGPPILHDVVPSSGLEGESPPSTQRSPILSSKQPT